MRQRHFAARVLLLAHEPSSPQMLLWRRRWPSHGGEAMPARENKQEEGKEEGVDEDE